MGEIRGRVSGLAGSRCREPPSPTNDPGALVELLFSRSPEGRAWCRSTGFFAGARFSRAYKSPGTAQQASSGRSSSVAAGERHSSSACEGGRSGAARKRAPDYFLPGLLSARFKVHYLRLIEVSTRCTRPSIALRSIQRATITRSFSGSTYTMLVPAPR